MLRLLLFLGLSTAIAKSELTMLQKTGMMGSIVLIEGENSSGTGFLARENQQIFLYTAAHVLSGNSTLSFTLTDGTKLKQLSRLQIADDVDVARFLVSDKLTKAIPRWHKKEERIAIHAPIAAFGNSDGTGVITLSDGKILGIGKENYEVSTEIIQGNSGGPIIHIKTGLVIGIATHLIAPREDIWAQETRFKSVRRFAARLDRNIKWFNTDFKTFSNEMQTIHNFDRKTQLVFAFAELQPYRDGLRLDTEVGGGRTADQIFTQNRDNPAVQGLIKLNENVLRYQQSYNDHALIGKYLEFYRYIYKTAETQTRTFLPSRFTRFHREDADLSLQHRKKAVESLVATIKEFQHLQKRVR
ncbi:MAG: serine protease [Verrucomicrobiota bacterium]